MGQGITQYRGQTGGNRFSPNIWHDCPLTTLALGSPGGAAGELGYMVKDEFLAFGGLLTSTTGDYHSENAYYSYQDSGNTIKSVATEVGGVIEIATDATDNDESWLQCGTATSVFGKISDTAGDDKKLWFETRFKIDQIASGNFFVGLAEEGSAAADFITDSDAMADKDFIGFRQLAGDLDGLDFVYRKNGQTEQVVIDVAQTLVADTWYKVGFVYDPAAVTSKRIKIYVDNGEKTTYVTGTNIAASTFPDGEEMHFIAGVKNGTTTAKKLYLDWFGLAQLG